jgi:hypothetical protein
LYDEFDPEAENPRGLDVLKLLCNDDPNALERERNRLVDQPLPNKKAIVLGWARQFSEVVTERHAEFWEANKKDLNMMQDSHLRDALLQGTNSRYFDAFKVFFKGDSLRREKEVQRLQNTICAELEISSPTSDLAAFQKAVQELHSILPETSKKTISLEKLKNGDVDALKALNEELKQKFPFERGKPTERISLISDFFGWEHPSSREETHSYALYYQMEVDRNLDTFMKSLKGKKPPELSEKAFKTRTRESLLQCTDRDLVSKFKATVQEENKKAPT